MFFNKEKNKNIIGLYSKNEKYQDNIGLVLNNKNNNEYPLLLNNLNSELIISSTGYNSETYQLNSFENLLKNNGGAIFFNFKGDKNLNESLNYLIKKYYREEDFYFLDLSKKSKSNYGLDILNNSEEHLLDLFKFLNNDYINLLVKIFIKLKDNNKIERLTFDLFYEYIDYKKINFLKKDLELKNLLDENNTYDNEIKLINQYIYKINDYPESKQIENNFNFLNKESKQIFYELILNYKFTLNNENCININRNKILIINFPLILQKINISNIKLHSILINELFFYNEIFKFNKNSYFKIFINEIINNQINNQINNIFVKYNIKYQIKIQNLLEENKSDNEIMLSNTNTIILFNNTDIKTLEYLNNILSFNMKNEFNLIQKTNDLNINEFFYINNNNITKCKIDYKEYNQKMILNDKLFNNIKLDYHLNTEEKKIFNENNIYTNNNLQKLNKKEKKNFFNKFIENINIKKDNFNYYYPNIKNLNINKKILKDYFIFYFNSGYKDILLFNNYNNKNNINIFNLNKTKNIEESLEKLNYLYHEYNYEFLNLINLEIQKENLKEFIINNNLLKRNGIDIKRFFSEKYKENIETLIIDNNFVSLEKRKLYSKYNLLKENIIDIKKFFSIKYKEHYKENINTLILNKNFLYLYISKYQFVYETENFIELFPFYLLNEKKKNLFDYNFKGFQKYILPLLENYNLEKLIKNNKEINNKTFFQEEYILLIFKELIKINEDIKIETISGLKEENPYFWYSLYNIVKEENLLLGDIIKTNYLF